VAGFAEKELDLKVEQNLLTVSGKKPEESEGKSPSSKASPRDGSNWQTTRTST
jgi:HSP20 family molecular chaperone IbpA